MLPGLEDLVIGKRISARRPGLGRPWDEEGAGARRLFEKDVFKWTGCKPDPIGNHYSPRLEGQHTGEVRQGDHQGEHSLDDKG